MPAAAVYRGAVLGGIPTVTEVLTKTGAGASFYAAHGSWPSLSAEGTIGFFSSAFDIYGTSSQPYTNRVAVSRPAAPGYSLPRTALFAGTSPGGVVQPNYPVIGQHEVYAVVKGQQTNNAAVIRVDESGTEQIVASTGAGAEDFTHVGWFADMTEDSKFVSFLGRRTSGQEGIFLRVFDAEWGSSSLIPLIDTNFVFAVDEEGDPIRFRSFDFNNRPCIIHQNGVNPAGVMSNSIVVLFHATPSHGSRGNPHAGNRPMYFNSQPGIWAARFTIESGLADSNYKTVHFRSLVPVIQVGDVIRDQAGDDLAIEDLQIFNSLGTATNGPNGAIRETTGKKPMPGDHVVAFWALADGQAFAIKGYHLDSDGDGLLDHWERGGGGIDIDRDGQVDLPLASMGADPVHRDLFLEIDWTGPRPSASHPAGWNNRPPAYGLTELMFAFANAPVTNADNTTGINLHIDAGKGKDLDFPDDPLSQNGMASADPIYQQGGDEVTTSLGERPDVVLVNPNVAAGNLLSLGALKVATLGSIKERFFGTTDKKARELAFRYAVIADFQGLMQIPGPLGMTNVFTVSSATPNQIWSESIDFGPGVTAADLTNAFARAEAVLLLNGPAAGQLRRLSLSPANMEVSNTGSGSFAFKFNLDSTDTSFTSTPAANTAFAVLDGSSGSAEFFVMDMATGFSDEDQHRLPSNDLVVSLGSVRAGMGRPNLNDTEFWRTLAHELGHTLGLAHGGPDPKCAFRGNDHLSLMSYSHQLRTLATNLVQVGGPLCLSAAQLVPPGPALNQLGGVVNSYSDGQDNLQFNEWDYLRMETWAAPWFLGNTFLRRGGVLLGAEDSPSAPTLDRGRDQTGPLVELEAPTNRVLAVGATLAPAISARDPSGVTQVRVRFDANGDGVFSAPGETGRATTADFQHFGATFPVISGTNGVRALLIEAEDSAGNITATRESFLVGAGALPDYSSPFIYFNASPPIICFAERPLDVGFSVYDDSSPPNGGIRSVEVSFDRDGDGSVTDPAEVFPAGLGPNFIYRPFTGALGEGQTNRLMKVVAIDRWGRRGTNSIAVTVLPPDHSPPVISLLEPAPGVTRSYGDAFPVLAQVTDNHLVAKVVFEADLNGNGTFDLGEGLIAQAGAANTYKAVYNPNGFATFSGPAGPRQLHISATDYYGNVSETNLTFSVADTFPPQVLIMDPPDGWPVSPSASFQVRVLATDDRGIDHVWMRYDCNGNGILDPDEFREAAAASDGYVTCEFNDCSGPAGDRMLEVIATDLSSRTSVVSRVVARSDAGKFTAGQTAVTSRAFLPTFTCPIGLAVTQAVFHFDVNGDGINSGPNEEFAAAAFGTNRILRAFFSNLSGPPGSRLLSISLHTTNAGEMSFATNVTVVAGGENPGTVSRKLASVSFLPEPSLEVPGYFSRGQVRSVGMASAARLGSNIVFGAYEPRENYGSLWVTDGSPAGTRLLARVATDNFLNSSTDDPVIDNYFAEYHGRLYFYGAQDTGDPLAPVAAVGGTLWETDGTTAGTQPFVSLVVQGIIEGNRPVVFQDRLYYIAYSQVFPLGPVLVRSDGTTNGTVPVRVSGLMPDRIVATASNLFLLQWNHNAPTDGWWISDGTSGGTSLLTNLEVQIKSSSGTFYRSGPEFTVISNLLFFPARTLTNGIELWRTDGTSQGTFPLADIEPGSGNSYPNNFTVLNNVLYFSASNSLTGTELWRTDGTRVGTWMVADIVPGFGNSLPAFLTTLDDRIYFRGADTWWGNELWVSDGTSAGTQLFTNLAPHPSNQPGYPNRHSAPGPIQAALGRLFFEADDGLGELGRELWVSDGTTAGTRLTRDIAELLPTGDFPIPPTLSSLPRRLTDGGSYAAFRANNNLYGAEIWRTDGTPGGTYLLKNNAPADAGLLTANGELLLYQMADPLRGRELGSSRAGFGLLRDFYAGPFSSSPSNYVWLGNRCFFTANEPVGIYGYLGTVLYITDGTSNGTVRLAEFDYGGVMPGVVSGGKYFFAGTRYASSGTEPWVSDGTPAGTLILGDLNLGYDSSRPDYFVAAGTYTFFVANDGVSGKEWWRSDGTPAGTAHLPELMPGPSGSDPVPVGMINGQLVFFAQTPASGWEPMALNPTTLAVNLLADTYPGTTGGFYNDYNLHFYHTIDRAFLWSAASAPAGGLWFTDGTPGGTRKVGGPDQGTIADFSKQDGGAFAGSRFLFAARGYQGGYYQDLEPWISDGTVAGTMLLTNIMPDLGGGYGVGSSPANFTAMSNNIVLFTAYEPAGGRELWRSDGTPTGTYQLGDLRPGSRSPLVQQLTSANRVAYFTAYTEESGRELWVTDGTVVGTHQVEDLNPGPQGSDPAALLFAGDSLYYFAADHGDDLSLRQLSVSIELPLLISDVIAMPGLGGMQLEFSYQRRLNALSLGDQFAIERSTDLGAWSEIPAVELSVIPSGAGESVRVRLPGAVGLKLFVRVRMHR